MPTEARKQPCVIWGRHKGPLAEESLAHQDWAKFTEDGEWMSPSPAGVTAQSSHAGTCWPVEASLKTLLLEPADNEPLQQGHCLPHACSFTLPLKQGMCSLSQLMASAVFCTWRSMGGTTELLRTKQVWCPLHWHFHVECLTAADGCFGIAQDDGQLPALVDSIAINDLTIFHKTKIQMHEQVYLLGKFFTSRAFNLWIYSRMDSIQFKANFISGDCNYCYNSYYQCWWMLLWLFYLWRFQLFFISYNYSVREQASSSENFHRYRGFYGSDKLGYPPGRVWVGQGRKQGSQDNWGEVGIALQWTKWSSCNWGANKSKYIYFWGGEEIK